MSDNALCFPDKRKAASVCRAGGREERTHTNTKTLEALVFSLLTAAKDISIEQVMQKLISKMMVTQLSVVKVPKRFKQMCSV